MCDADAQPEDVETGSGREFLDGVIAGDSKSVAGRFETVEHLHYGESYGKREEDCVDEGQSRLRQSIAGRRREFVEFGEHCQQEFFRSREENIPTPQAKHFVVVDEKWKHAHKC